MTVAMSMLIVQYEDGSRTAVSDSAEHESEESSAEDPMQIEEVTQAEADATTASREEEQHAGPSSPQKTESPGIMQSMLDTAKNFLGGKPDEVCIGWSFFA